MKDKLIEVLAWAYSLSSTFLFLKISSEGIFRQIHNIPKFKKQKSIIQNKNKNRSNNKN